MKLSTRALRIIAIAALTLSSVPAGFRPALAQGRASASAGALSPREPLLTQNHPAQSGAGGAPALEQPIGLPRVRDYQTIPELRDIYFDFGTANVRPDDAKTLNANAAWLRAHPSYLLLIEGHCDNRGATSTKNEFNMDLGEQRAEAAMKYLIEQGVDPSRIITLSYGAERPLCTEESEQCWRQNRRSRFLVKPR